MKKSLIAVATLSALSGVAHAQSSVTLYGIIDEGIDFQSNAKISAGLGKSRYFLDSGGGLQGSRWGLKGAEDLGGGLKTVFQVENGFNLNTGGFSQSGLEFGRQAFVGLSSATYGTVTLGRQYDSSVDFVGPLIFGDQIGTSYSAFPGDLNNLNNSVRINNSIKYTSPTVNGLTLDALYSLGGVAGSTGRNQIYSVGAGYVNGPISLAAAFLKVNQPNTSFFSNAALGSGQLAAGGSSISANTIFGGYATANSYQTASAGGMYRIGPATIGVIYTNTKFQNMQSGLSGLPTSASGPVGTAVFNAAEINFSWHFTPAWQVGGAYSYTRGSQVASTSGARFGGATYNQFSLATDYTLSKRTDVYLAGVYQNASGIDSTGTTATASLSGLTPSANNHQALVRVGMRHKF